MVSKRRYNNSKDWEKKQINKSTKEKKHMKHYTDAYIDTLVSNESISKKEKDNYEFSQYLEHTDNEFYEYEEVNSVENLCW